MSGRTAREKRYRRHWRRSWARRQMVWWKLGHDVYHQDEVSDDEQRGNRGHGAVLLLTRGFPVCVRTVERNTQPLLTLLDCLLFGSQLAIFRFRSSAAPNITMSLHTQASAQHPSLVHQMHGPSPFCCRGCVNIGRRTSGSTMCNGDMTLTRKTVIDAFQPTFDLILIHKSTDPPFHIAISTLSNLNNYGTIISELFKLCLAL